MSATLRPQREVGRGLLALGLGGLVLAVMVVAPHIEVVDRGHLVDFTDRDVVRVDVFGAFTMLAAPETRADTDLMNTIVLGVLTGLALLAAVLATKSRLRWFFGLAAAGAFLACLDEGFELTETLVYNAGWIGALGFPPRKVDVLDLLPVLLFVWFFRDVLASSTAALWFWATGGVFFLASLVLEVVAATPVEDAIEVVASASLVLGMLVLALSCLRSPATVPS